jgi:hypothetical protein
LIVAAVCALVLPSCKQRGARRAVPSGRPAASTTTAPPITAADRPGVPVRAGGLTVTVVVFDDPVPAAPGAIIAVGSHVAAVDTTIQNNDTSVHTVALRDSFQLMDGTGKTFTSDPTIPVMPSPPDGDFSPGASKRGLVPFIIPNLPATYRLVIRGGDFGTRTTTIALG